jgi:hypothetical protein
MITISGSIAVCEDVLGFGFGKEQLSLVEVILSALILFVFGFLHGNI